MQRFPIERKKGGVVIKCTCYSFLSDSWKNISYLCSFLWLQRPKNLFKRLKRGQKRMSKGTKIEQLNFYIDEAGLKFIFTY